MSSIGGAISRSAGETVRGWHLPCRPTHTTQHNTHEFPQKHETSGKGAHKQIGGLERRAVHVVDVVLLQHARKAVDQAVLVCMDS